MNVREQMVLEFADLEDGTTAAGQLCPSCAGGQTGERTLSVAKRENVLLWKCHRDSCGFSGAATVGGKTYRRTEIPHTRGIVGRTISRTSEALDAYTREYLASRYQLTDSHIGKYGIGWDRETNRVVLPVRDFAGQDLGVALRALDSNVQPKTKTHTEKDAISWFVNRTVNNGVIVVEDQFSAIRASDYLTSVALLGTHLNDERVAEIKHSGLSPVYLALDADAWATAVKYAVRYRSQLHPRLIKLDKDIKDQTDQELRKTLNFLPHLLSDSQQ